MRHKDWSLHKLRDLIEIKHGFPFESTFYAVEGPYVLLTPGNFREEGGFRWLAEKQKFYSGTVPKGFLLAPKQMLIAMTEQAPGLLGSTFLVPEGRLYLHNQRLGLVREKAAERLSMEYLHYFLATSPVRNRISSESAGTKVKHTSPDKLLGLEIALPPIAEQRTIAKLLQTWDEAISKLESLIVLARQESSAISLKVFEHNYRSKSGLLKARDVFMPVSERARPDLPLLAVMQDAGIVRRDELERRVTMPDGDTSTYKVVRPGDFVISLRSFEGGLEYSEVLGLVSPAYTVLRPTREICADYYRHFFKSRSFIGRLDKMIFGIRDGKQIAFRDFGDMLIPHPKVTEQERQRKVLNAATQMIELNGRKKQAIELQKRVLMQKLLTGDWRVPC